MTLLETLTAAAAAADGEKKATAVTSQSLILDADAILLTLQPESENPSSTITTTTATRLPIRRLTGWRVPEAETDIAAIFSQFAESLARKLKNPKSLKPHDFFSLLNSYLIRISGRIGIPIGADAPPSDPNFARLAIEKLGFTFPKKIISLIVDGCLVFEQWEVIETIVWQNLISNSCSVSLIEKLVEKNRSDLICLCVRKIPDLRPSEVLLILKFFLSPPKGSYVGMREIRQKWEKEALWALEKATQKKGAPEDVKKIGREAAVLLMMAHDGFLASELCLHNVFGSNSVDSIVLSWAVSKLDGREVVGLVRYFAKWLEKYWSFPQAAPCPSAGPVLGLSCLESVPTLEAVVMGLGLVLDEHFSHLVLNSVFHEEMRRIEKVIGDLASEAGLCSPVAEIVKLLQSEADRS